MFLHRHTIVPDGMDASWYESPPLDAARGIVTGVALSGLLWSWIIALVWLLTR